MIATLTPDPYVIGSRVTYVPYSVTVPGVSPRTGFQVVYPDGRKVWFNCHYPTSGPRHCVRFTR
jgi:hypothetical protein